MEPLTVKRGRDQIQSAPWRDIKSAPPRPKAKSFFMKKTDEENDTDTLESKSAHSAAFPKNCQHTGYLDVRTRETKPWKRRYFAVNNNFLLSAATPHASKLERVIPLEGSNVRSQTVTSDMTFDIFMRKHKLYFRAPSPTSCKKWSLAIQRASKLKIKDLYRFLYTLGTSGMTKVVAAKHKTSARDSAIKIVDKRMCDRKMLKTEIQILKKLDNPFIVQLYDLIETKKYLYIVMEQCKGGELFDLIAELDGGSYTEKDCCIIMHQIANGIKYMHSMGIVHRDLKPENILCSQPNCITKGIKIADFGISKMFKKEKMDYISKNAHLNVRKKHKNNNFLAQKQMKTVVGTMTYTAPEILNSKRYDYTVDFWSVGVIMFILLCGYPPFWGEYDNEIKTSILESEPDFDDDDWMHVSKTTKDLVFGLLNKEPNSRKTCDDILKLTFKVESKSMSFVKAKNNFKKTVLKSRFERHSLSLYETNSKQRNIPNLQNRNSNKTILSEKNSEKKENNNSNSQNMHKMPIVPALLPRQSSDDMSDLLSSRKKHDDMNKKIESFAYRKSRGTEELHELQLIHEGLIQLD